MAASETPIMYGISNCDTIKKARQWLNSQGINYHFHDVRKEGLNQETVERWLQHLGWERLINRRGTSWRQLSEEDRATMDNQRARDAILTQPTLFKRPLLALGDKLHVGFKPDQYRALFAA